MVHFNKIVKVECDPPIQHHVPYPTASKGRMAAQPGIYCVANDGINVPEDKKETTDLDVAPAPFLDQSAFLKPKDQDAHTEKEKSEYLLDLAIFMASSTRDVIHFEHYGAWRLLSALIRVLDISNYVEHLKKDRFLDEVRKELLENRPLIKDKEAFAVFLDQLIVKMLEEYKHRLNANA